MADISQFKPQAREERFSGGSGSDDCPPATLPNLVHGWLMERLQEGDRINRTDPAHARSSELVNDLMGDQEMGAGSLEDRRVVLNQTRKAINTHASLLTDVKPLWEWQTRNENYKRHAAVYNDHLMHWWMGTFADMALTDAARYALTIGASDVLLEYDKNFNSGDSRMLARDWRDTLPIRPERSHSMQDWEGVIFCETHSLAKVRATFPGSVNVIESGGGVGVGTFTRYRKLTRPEQQVQGTLSGLGGKHPDSKYTAQLNQSTCVLYRAFFRDRSINKTGQRVLMGPLGANWCYWVEPGKPLYPRGRAVVFTDAGPLFDGPNPYWLGNWPAARLNLNPWPWLMVGMPLAFDLRQLQKVLNITTNDILKVFSQHVNRGSVWGKNAPDSTFRMFDPTKPNWKLKVNSLVGTNFEMKDGPQLPPWTFQMLTFLFQKWDELSGTANLTQLLQLRQVPGKDTIEKYLEAMTPEIRLEARQLERFLREIAEMWLSNAVQFYSPAKREMVLGASGRLLEDVDLDPNSMIPALAPGQQGYTPEFDVALPRDVRARAFMRQFGFFVAPNSILAMHSDERKMMYLQLARQGYMDFWTLSEMLQLPNVGEPPFVPLPKNLKPEEVANLPINPQTGEPQVPSEVRRPVTITERLMAQQMLGLGQTVSPAGRKATGQEPPELKQKSDGSTTVTES